MKSDMDTLQTFDSKKTIASVATGLFAVFAVIYFIPAVTAPAKISIPLFLLALAGCWVLPWQMTVAMFCSFVGDFFSVDLDLFGVDNFIWKMIFFAIAHVFFVIWFFAKIRENRINPLNPVIFLLAVIVLASAFINIIPAAPEGVLRIGSGIYACIIVMMFYSSLTLAFGLRRNKRRLLPAALLGTGAVLFLTSDYILSWNIFVTPLPYSSYLIMVPYYAGQLLIFLGAYKYKTGHR